MGPKAQSSQACPSDNARFQGACSYPNESSSALGLDQVSRVAKPSLNRLIDAFKQVSSLAASGCRCTTGAPRLVALRNSQDSAVWPAG